MARSTNGTVAELEREQRAANDEAKAAAADLPHVRLAKAESQALAANYKRIEAERRAKLPSDTPTLIKALLADAKRRDAIDAENDDDRAEEVRKRRAESVSRAKQKAEREAFEARERERQRVASAEYRGVQLRHAAELLIAPASGDSQHNMRAALTEANRNAPPLWSARVEEAHAMNDAGAHAELARWFAAQLGATPAPWL